MLRYKFITHKGIQFKLATTFLIWFVVFLMTVTGIYFLNFSGTASRAEEMQIHDELVTKMLLVDQAQDLAIWYGTTVVIFALLMWLYFMAYSHRLTGPIYKMEKLLEKSIHNRNLPDEPLSFRKTDAFHELADKFNQFVEVAKEKQSKSK